MKKFLRRNSWITISTRIILPVFLTLVLFIIAIYAVIEPTIREYIMASKKEMIKELTNTAWYLMNDYQSRVETGELTRDEAQERAKMRLRQLRYGKELKDYFWINDMHPKMVMHPYRSDLEGKDISHLKDSTGKRYVIEFVETVKKSGAGYVMYEWQWKDNPDLIVPKLSYVKGFEPWGWIIGTGIYIEDVQERIDAIILRLNYALAVILFIVAILSIYIIFESIQRERKRDEAETGLKNSEALLSSIIEFLPDAALVIDKNERIIAWNRAMENMTGIRGCDMIGKGDYEYAIPFYGEKRPLLINIIINPESEYKLEYDNVLHEGNHLVAEAYITGLGKDGRYLYARAAPLYDSEGNISGAVETIRDITDYKNSENELKMSLREKEILLKEIHHRVKNNLQIISSLLSLQSDYIESERDLELFMNSQSQIMSMASIHEKLYRSDSFSNIDMKGFIDDLTGQLGNFYKLFDSSIRIETDIHDVQMPIDTAIPCALLINEILTNSLKHAFPHGKGTIRVFLDRDGSGSYILKMNDNGIGMPDDEMAMNRKSLGLKLIEAIVKQLHGEMEKTTTNGTAYCLRFTDVKKSRPRMN